VSEEEEKEDFNAENQSGTSNNGFVQKKSELLLLEKTDRSIDRSICSEGNLLSCVPVSRTESEEGKEKK
jgi:hypothetical protein